MNHLSQLTLEFQLGPQMRFPDSVQRSQLKLFPMNVPPLRLEWRGERSGGAERDVRYPASALAYLIYL